MSELVFKDVTMDMRSAVRERVLNLGIKNSEYTFTSLMMWGAKGRIKAAVEGGTIYLLYPAPDRPLRMLAPLCADAADYPAAIARAEQHIMAHGEAPMFFGVPEQLKQYFESAGYVVSPDRDNYDYVYNAQDLRTLAGKKYHAKRNHINRFTADYSFSYVKLTAQMAEECIKVYFEWADEKDESAIAAEEEYDAIRICFDHMDELGLVGGAIYIENKLSAFTIGEQVDDEMAVIYCEKADDVPGLYTVINQQFVEHEFEGVPLINREEDMGLEGLRRAKLSYQPAKFIEKYTAIKQTQGELN